MFFGRALKFLLVIVLVGGAVGGALMTVGMAIYKAPEGFAGAKNMLADQKYTMLLLLTVAFVMLGLMSVVFGPLVGFPIIAIFSAPAFIWVLLRARCPAWVILCSALWPVPLMVMGSGKSMTSEKIFELASLCFAASIAGLVSREVAIARGYILR